MKIKKYTSKDFVDDYMKVSDKLEENEKQARTVDLTDLLDRVKLAQSVLKEPMPNMIIAGEINCIQAHLNLLKDQFMKKIGAEVKTRRK